MCCNCSKPATMLAQASLARFSSHISASTAMQIQQIWVGMLHLPAAQHSLHLSLVSLVMQIQQIWLDVLHLQRVSIHANFFQVGGSSLLAVMVASQIQSSLHMQLPAVQLFTDKTIAQVSDTVSRLRSGPPSNRVGPPLRPDTPLEKLTSQEMSEGVYCTLNQVCYCLPCC